LGKNKLERFAENETFEHFFQPSFDDLMTGFALKGKWHTDFFGNNNPIVIEIGCWQRRIYSKSGNKIS